MTAGPSAPSMPVACAPPTHERAGMAARNAALNETHSMAALRSRGGAVVRAVEERRRRLVASAVVALEPGLVVDLGCEDGWIAEGYAHASGRTVLADLDAAVLARAAERRLPRTTCVVADALHPGPLGGDGADVVVLSAILEHLERPIEGLEAAARLVAPGGRIVAYVPADGPILALKAILARTRLGFLARGVSLEPAPGHLHRFDRRSFSRLLSRVGQLERLTFDPVALGYLGVVRVTRRGPDAGPRAFPRAAALVGSSLVDS